MIPATSQAVLDIAEERARQISTEHYSISHDDHHVNGEMAAAAACYALGVRPRNVPRNIWPWEDKWWKPTDRRRNLVKAAALLVAEIERIDRANALAKVSS